MAPPALPAVLHLVPESDRLAEIGIRLALTALGAFLLTTLGRLLIACLRTWMVRAGAGREIAITGAAEAPGERT